MALPFLSEGHSIRSLQKRKCHSAMLPSVITAHDKAPLCVTAIHLGLCYCELWELGYLIELTEHYKYFL